MITKPFKKAKFSNISQPFHEGHKAIDWVSSYGTPICSPEKVKIEWIIGDGYTPESYEPMKRGYGVWMTGLETGFVYVYWHFLPYLPVWGGDIIERGKIIGYMGNSGLVRTGGVDVPVGEVRTLAPHLGTHLHQVVFKQGHNVGVWKGDELDPLPLTNMDIEPTYTIGDGLIAIGKTTSKMIKLFIK